MTQDGLRPLRATVFFLTQRVATLSQVEMSFLVVFNYFQPCVCALFKVSLPNRSKCLSWWTICLFSFIRLTVFVQMCFRLYIIPAATFIVILNIFFNYYFLFTNVLKKFQALILVCSLILLTKFLKVVILFLK